MTRPRISQRVREQAALICAIAASVPPYPGRYRGEFSYYNNIASDADLRAGLTLAGDAWRALTYRGNDDRREWTQALDAEAEALIRCGWSPGDEL